MHPKTLENAVNEILDGGTRIVSFKFEGKQIKNVLIGSFEARRCIGLVVAMKETILNRAMTKNDRVTLLFGISNNDCHSVTAWDVSKISDFSFVLPRHEHKNLWQKLLAILDQMLLEIG